MTSAAPHAPPAASAAAAPRTEAVAFDSASFVNGLPGLPGVYRMLSVSGEVLYVGKARDLKKRVASYFQKSGLTPRTARMVSQVGRMEITVTGSEDEALILENNLIKSLAPRYNILFRDDKSYPYLMLGGGDFPRLGFHRGALDRSGRYFGPFPHSGAVRESINLLQRVFRLRTCEDSVFANRTRPCLLHQIRRCSAPCVGLIEKTAYSGDVNHALLLLEGRSDEVMKLLSTRMQEAAGRLEFEEAAIFRDQIQALAKMSQRQYADTASDQDADVIALAVDHGVACVNLVMIRGGRHLGDRSFFPHNAQERTPEEVMQAFLDQHYLERPVPPVIVAGAPIDAAEIEAFLGARARRKVHLVLRASGDRRAWLERAEKNARLALNQRLSEQSTQETRLASLREALGLPDSAARIECFDVSHTQGEAAVASCVVYDGLDLRRGEYRRFNIGEVTPGDDYAAIKQALSRRYVRVAGGEGRVPDLILIDGGKGQAGAAASALAELGLNDVALVGVAKGAERRAGQEQLWIPGRSGAIDLRADDPGLHLIQQIRDEAHRFAVTGHRGRRSKTRVTSSLEGIRGIGVKRRRELLARFGGLKGVMGASVEDLAQSEGVSLRLAERIYRELHAA